MEELLRMLEESEAENDRLRSQMTVIAGEESYYEDENDVLSPLAGEGSSKSVKFGQTPLGGGSERQWCRWEAEYERKAKALVLDEPTGAIGYDV